MGFGLSGLIISYWRDNREMFRKVILIIVGNGMGEICFGSYGGSLGS